MKKALIYASVASMIEQFNKENITILLSLGYQVDIACNLEVGSSVSKEHIEILKKNLKNQNINYFHIPIPRNIFDIIHLIKAYSITKKLLNDNEYDLIHCHSPIGGVICRLANKNSNSYEKTKMIYTAHGFHFFYGNNKMKNFIFKGIEKYAAKYTDVLITINKEDFNAAKKFKLKNNGKIKYIPDIGIDLDYISNITGKRNKLIKELNISSNSILMLSIGEINKNKNHIAVINILDMLPSNVHYLICGIGKEKKYLEKIIKKKGLINRVHFLGYRNDIIEIIKSCNLFIFPSKREGLSVALMEALACGIPVIASNIRGNKDLISDGENGYLFDQQNSEELLKTLDFTLNENSLAFKLKTDMNYYSSNNITKLMHSIYSED